MNENTCSALLYHGFVYLLKPALWALSKEDN